MSKLVIRSMQLTDLDVAFQLKLQAKWNQTRSDLERFLSLEPEGCFLAEEDGVGVGTAMGFVFGPIGWVAMVLVDQSRRGQGYGTALVKRCCDYLVSRGVATMRLDATPLGRPIYEKLGFVTDYDLTRFVGTPGATSRSIASVRPVLPRDREAILNLDVETTGTHRAPLIKSLLDRHPGHAWVSLDEQEVVKGYVTMRPGAFAWHAGPCLARTAAAGIDLLETAAASVAGDSLYLDIPCSNRPATTWATSRGFSAERLLTRMSHGSPPAERLTWMFAGSGPEKG